MKPKFNAARILVPLVTAAFGFLGGLSFYKEANVHVVFPVGEFRGGNTFLEKQTLFGNDYTLPSGTLEHFCKLIR